MNKNGFTLTLNICLSIGIVLFAILGRSVGIQQGLALPVSVVWPATGFSLAALLLFGYKVAPGIFIGNFAYNFLFLILYPPNVYLTTFQKIILTIFVAIGSFAQALVSAYIIKTYSTAQFFRTGKDIFNFLVPASILACLIGSTIGVISLTAVGGLDKDLIFPVWLTFWLGDTVGIYVMTPLLVTWILRSQPMRFSNHIPEIVGMIFLFILFSFVTYLTDDLLPHLYVPISIWAAYLFRMYGASLSIFLMTAASILFATSLGFKGMSLISLITFIAITVVASLIVAVIANEKQEAWDLLDARNLYLKKEVDVKMEVVEHVHKEVSQKRKLATRGFVSKLLTAQVDAPLKDIEQTAKNSLKMLDEIQTLFEEQKSLSSTEKALLNTKLHHIKEGLTETLNSQNRITELFKLLSV